MPTLGLPVALGLCMPWHAAWRQHHVLRTFGHCSQARLAQSAERKALNLVVVGSSPTVGVPSSLGDCMASTACSKAAEPRLGRVLDREDQGAELSAPRVGVPGALGLCMPWCAAWVQQKRVRACGQSSQARLAQSAERKALNLVVVGASPTVGVSSALDYCMACVA